MLTMNDYTDILKPGTCTLCETQTLTFTDPEGEELCVNCLEACVEELPNLPADPAITRMGREIIANMRRKKNHARN